MTRFYSLGDLCTELPEGMDLPDGAVEIDRLPENGERVDPKSGEISLDAALKAEMEADPRAVAAAQIQKSVEAALVMSGVELTQGLLAEEAAAKGTDITDLAAAVLAESADARAAEIDRTMLKTSA